ncbi:hypothetical protein [Nonomuraea sp. SYSU D8015]|uniref:hypothetical protein n=1 Tax=Nonomuraea sp. SYSU D8015 TaxID=2593644 RepID=UPI0016604A1A|nr:hypothetical protein [Nonomuraea sp. SYSU D8015]
MAPANGTGRAGGRNPGAGSGRGRRPAVKLTGTLAEISKRKGTHWDVLGDISNDLAAEHLKPIDRRTDVIHPSEMAKDDWCARNTFYRIMNARAGKLMTKGEFNFQQEGIFATGHALHDKWQGWLRLGGDLYGQWKCMHCGWLTGIQLDPVTCPQCKSPAVRYAEVPIRAEKEFLIEGHSDGMLLKKARLIEIKTIGMGTLRMDAPKLLQKYYFESEEAGKKLYDLDGLWADLQEPLPSHVRQLQIYLYITMRLMGLEVRRGSFIYEFKPNQATKEFGITLDLSVVEPLLEKATAIKDAVYQTGTIPEREFDRDSSTCKACPYFSQCWSDVAPNQQNQDVRDEADQPSKSRSNARAGSRRTGAARAARRVPAATAEGPDGAGGRRADGAVRPAQRMGRLRRRPTQSGGDR